MKDYGGDTRLASEQRAREHGAIQVICLVGAKHSRNPELDSMGDDT